MPEAEQGLNVARIASLRAGVPVDASAVTDQPLLLVGPAGHRLRRRAHHVRLRRRRDRRRHRVDEPGADGRQQGLARTRRSSTAIPDVYLSTGLVAENHAREYAHLARGAGRVRAAQPPARARRDRRRPVRRRDHAADVHGRRRRRQRRRPMRDVTFAQDEGPRRDTSAEALAKLRPAFHATGTVTAGNSSQTSDGAAAVLVMSAELREGARPSAARALRRLCHRRRRAGALRHRAGAGDPQGAEAGGADARRHRSRRAERGVRRAGARRACASCRSIPSG